MVILFPSANSKALVKAMSSASWAEELMGGSLESDFVGSNYRVARSPLSLY